MRFCKIGLHFDYYIAINVVINLEILFTGPLFVGGWCIPFCAQLFLRTIFAILWHNNNSYFLGIVVYEFL